MFKIKYQQYFVILNMFCFLFSFNFIVFLVLHFDHWYVLYVHNLIYIMSEYGFSVTRIFPYIDRIYDFVLIQEYMDQRKPIL